MTACTRRLDGQAQYQFGSEMISTMMGVFSAILSALVAPMFNDILEITELIRDDY